MVDLMTGGDRTRAPAVAAALPCIYCGAATPSASFARWAKGTLLMSASCPHCRLRITLGTATWRRWSGLSDGGTS
jgi:hypothetical protein